MFQETATEETLQWYGSDSQMLVWTLTSTEVLSALHRRVREGRLKPQELTLSLRRIQILKQNRNEIHALEVVRQRAERLLKIHPLRAADPLQLGAAFVAAQERPQNFSFVSFDYNLATAADKEGFAMLPVS